MRSTRVASICSVLACACGPAERATLPTDASVDVESFQWVAAPFSATGTTPAGRLDDMTLIRARYRGAWCSYYYEIEIAQSVDIDSDAVGPRLVVSVPFPEETASPQSGTFTARATVEDDTGELASTESVSLTAERIDPSSQPQPHIAGRFVASETGWSFDFSIDVISQYSSLCPPGI